MTERLYRQDAYIRDFTAQVISCEKNGKYFDVVLDKSAFFPEGGGQPGDKGKIGRAFVINTIEKNDDVIHICTESVSGEVECSLDWVFRFLNMQQHTGEHIFSGVLHGKTGFDNVGFHMGENEITVDFNGFVPSSLLTEIEDETNRAIYENIPIEIIYPSADELEKYDYRSKKEIEGQIRLVKIGDVDLCACCGTHTARTGEAGIVKVTSCMNYKQGVRITLQIGYKALLDYRRKNDSVALISAALCAKTHEVASAAEKMKERLKDTDFKYNELKKEMLSLKCENVSSDFPAVFDNASDAENARIMADIIASKAEISFAFSGSDENGWKYAVASKTKDVREIGKNLNAALNGRGGGKPEMVMGSLNAKKEEISEFIKSVI